MSTITCEFLFPFRALSSSVVHDAIHSSIVIPTGIYALTIPTCATWNQTGITVAGNANGTLGSDSRSLWYPVSIFVDNNGTLYICDRDNNRIMKYYANATSGLDVAGNLTAGSSSSQLNSPKGVAVDQYGAIIVGDSSNYRIQKFPVGSTVGTTIAINSSLNPLGQTRDLHIDVNNNIYVTDSDYSRILKFYPYNGIGVILAPTNGSGSGANQLLTPYGNFIDGNQTLYVADRGNHRIQMWLVGATSGTTVAGVTGIPGSNLTLLNSPNAVIVDNNGYVRKC
jgi:sugar lactone lactonase YvrE